MERIDSTYTFCVSNCSKWGQVFYSIEDVESLLGQKYTEEDRAYLSKTVPILSTDDNYVCFPGAHITLEELRVISPGSFMSEEKTWYSEFSFAAEERLKLKWYILRKFPGEHSYDELQNMIPKSESLPSPLESVFALFIHLKSKNCSLCTRSFWCNESDPYEAGFQYAAYANEDGKIELRTYGHDAKLCVMSVGESPLK